MPPSSLDFSGHSFTAVYAITGDQQPAADLAQILQDFTVERLSGDGQGRLVPAHAAIAAAGQQGAGDLGVGDNMN